MTRLLNTFTIFVFYFNNWQSYYFFYKSLSMQRTTFIFIGAAFALLFVIITEQIFEEVQYVHREDIHFLTYYTMKVFVS